jgi:Domain of unknown function (DUF4145)
MDRRLLKLPFGLENAPDWLCPTCGRGTLRIEKDSFVQRELRRSREIFFYTNDYEDIKYVYSCLLICSNGKCDEVVTSIGIGSVDCDIVEDEYGEQNQVYSNFFLPKFFEPHLKLIHIPQDCPDSVSTPLNESFKLFFSSPSAASNNVRIAIEELLTELKVKRFNVSKGRRLFINLHQRIELLPAKYAQFKDMILAIKWLGNAGSHGHSEVTIDDAMDAYELTEHILKEIYEPKAKKLKALAKKVNKKKGPSK